MRLPFFINSNPATEGFIFSIDFDEEVLEAGPEMERVFAKPDGSEWSFAAYDVDNSNATPGNGGVDEGFMIGAVIFSLTEGVFLPIDTDTEVVAFSMGIKPDAPIGSTDVKFMDGARHPKAGNSAARNRLSLGGETVPADTEITPVIIHGCLQIVPDIIIFIRGDSNGDANIDLADAQATLGYLFLAADSLPCLDAADANDDGKLNLTDPVATLQFLFMGGAPLPAPSGTQAEDPTPDSLDCAS